MKKIFYILSFICVGSIVLNAFMYQENKKAKYNAVYQQLVDRFNIEQGTLKSVPKSGKSKNKTGWSF